MTKRSGTKEPPDPIFFTDRDLGRSVVPEALAAAGLRVEPYHKHFKLDAVPDSEWLRFVGSRGWVALSHNKYIRYERDELDDLMTFGVKAFFIIGKGPHAAFADAIIKNIDGIRRLIRKHDGPFAAKVFQNRKDVELWVSYEQWLRERRPR